LELFLILHDLLEKREEGLGIREEWRWMGKRRAAAYLLAAARKRNGGRRRSGTRLRQGRRRDGKRNGTRC
jgi:hypothetical protein